MAEKQHVEQRTFPLCLECAWAWWPRHNTGLCRNKKVVETLTAKAREQGGSCGLDGIHWKPKK